MPAFTPDRFKMMAAMLLCLMAGTVSAQQLDEADARFFLMRTGFAPDRDEVARYSHLSRRQAVEQVLAETRSTAATAVPGWIDEQPISSLNSKDKSDDEKKRCANRSSAAPLNCADGGCAKCYRQQRR
ncbi:hypothetical protein RGU77_09640 [Actimicrobium sp. CCI2.3]|uniref:hypothetical protein n=1 Tax=Actimicrobium sp. CCI2.3 TaxID=3048616 RepID=UPI002AB531EA|nr:hypothetical protein [Actimicrobium sp. CCI2.3]MDY7574544.1 hypothetical protein [Actimicrobium sp. CCI2.3]